LGGDGDVCPAVARKALLVLASHRDVVAKHDGLWPTSVLSSATADSLAYTGVGADGVDDDGVVGHGAVVADQCRVDGRFDDGVLRVRSGEAADRLQGVPEGEHLQPDMGVVVAAQEGRRLGSRRCVGVLAGPRG
jgi:hypothetical protein